jgi:hypothetical protein
MMHRREFLAILAALLGAPAAARAGPFDAEGVRLAATWQAGHGYRAGILEYGVELAIRAAIDLPTRAHGLLSEPAGTLLTVARRPGDWLLRWDRQGRALTWRWVEPGRAFAGHVLASVDGRTVYTTEMHLDSGAGLVGVRDAKTLNKLAEWPTFGIDPHELTWDATHPGCLIVANGGVPTQPETGRLKRDLARMDSSLLRLDAATGERLKQWRLVDPRLSLRHLAWNGKRLGIALQAEHDDVLSKDAAPVLAVLENDQLRTVSSPSMRGYGGSVVAVDDGFVVSCPRQHGLASYGYAGFKGFIELAEACPLAVTQERLWAGGGGRVLVMESVASVIKAGAVSGIRLDNHWIAI